MQLFKTIRIITGRGVPSNCFGSKKNILNKYQDLVNEKKIKRDERQVRTINRLEQLNTQIIDSYSDWKNFKNRFQQDISEYEQKKIKLQKEQEFLTMKNQEAIEAESKKQKGFFSVFSTEQPIWNPTHEVFYSDKQQKTIKMDDIDTSPYDLTQIKGLYLHGSPGSGKTFVMDMFYDQLEIQEKSRIHFNQFMMGIHSALHQIKGPVQDPLILVAQLKSQHIRLLCLDEFQVTDIGDALMLKKLFEYLIKFNVILVATSNRPPDDLYKNGLQRHVFQPFIPFIKEKCDVIDIQSDVDYRYSHEAPSTNTQKPRIQTYLHPADESENMELEKIFQKISGCTTIGSATQINVIEGRDLQVPRCHNGVAYYEFSELCDANLASSDYIAICQNFKAIVVKDIPVISIDNKNQARRFIVLIDQMYNYNVKLYCTAQRDIQNLFKRDVQSSAIVSNDHMDTFFQTNKGDGDSELHDEAFAIDRTISRIVEMQSKSYLERLSYNQEITQH